MTNFNLNSVEINVNKLTDIMDYADGNPDGKIGAKVWNQFNDVFETKKIKNYKEAQNARDIITKYFDSITNTNNPQQSAKDIAAAKLTYLNLVDKALNIASDGNYDEMLELFDKFKIL